MSEARGIAGPRCPACGDGELAEFYYVAAVPAHSVLLMPTREQARAYPKGDIALGHCSRCGFVSNLAFDAALHQYSAQYEETQGFSPTFNAFHEQLAAHLIDRYDLRGKRIIEIGCGKGEFLGLLCAKGDNRGLGFDPAYVEERRPGAAATSVRFVRDFYTDEHAGHDADLICCKMTLEHIHEVGEFVATIRRSIGARTDTVVFFQVPDATRILEDVAFWDVYYEHCSYFTAGSLRRLFEANGFEVMDVSTGYGGQYLMLEARAAAPGRPRPDRPGADLERVDAAVARFREQCGPARAAWRQRLQRAHAQRSRTVVWGAGSKAVAFLTTLAVEDEVEAAVDINPYKHDTYLPGTGHRIVAPAALRALPPDLVIVMNPIYLEEIRAELAAMSLQPETVAV